MIGIVLWSDATAGKAVIWCEDQGDLAFYSHVGSFEDYGIRVGDWVLFDVKLQGDLRLAHSIEVLHEPGCPNVADGLSASKPKRGGAVPLQLVGQEEEPGEGKGAEFAGSQAPATTAATAALLAQTHAACVKMPKDLADSVPGRSVLPAPAGQNVIAFPIKGDGGLRRA